MESTITGTGASAPVKKTAARRASRKAAHAVSLAAGAPASFPATPAPNEGTFTEPTGPPDGDWPAFWRVRAAGTDKSALLGLAEHYGSPANLLKALFELQEPEEEPLPRFLLRTPAAQYVRQNWGIPCSPRWLAKLAVTGGGPIFQHAGRRPIYTPANLDAWAKSRISAIRRSTSERRKSIDARGAA